ncbi:uncharacterized protein LOC112572218 [Pomacea canaliculata]|uniref:uncharacterized protein LOC112572218 n=1 Tax=Pomacea canaliculata TaxID=400727 RepID=UPI000D73B75F|nr:uncharacterized protein LOC112572218 [Pomacea canaliculata]
MFTDPVAEQCSRNPTTFLPHPSNCHQYYNCSGNSNLYPSRPDPDSANFYLYECTYPQLFNKNTLRCEDYRQVQCGERFEPVDKCEYIQYQCRGPNCIPCNVYSPSCKDLPDGPDVYRGREWTPYFSICQDQRLVNTSTCPRDEILNVARLFSPVRRECQNLYGIPVEHGGYFLNCTGRPDGLYSDDVTNRPNLYFRCDSGVQTRIYLCPDGQRFYQQTSSCTSLVYVPLNKPEFSSTMLLSSPSVIVGVVLVIVAVARDSVPELCSRYPTAVFAHPSNCHQYYNCSGNSYLIYYPSRPDPDSANFYLYECTYPQLFNKNTLQCEDYGQVQCGERFEPVDKCEYTRYQCQKVSHCIPCDVHSPSCKDLPDGPNVYRGREWTPYFAVCQDQRLVNTSTCPRDERLAIAQLFSPVRRECQNLYGIPVEHGGYFLNCTGRPDGLYSDDVTNRPNLYFRCDSGGQSICTSLFGVLPHPTDCSGYIECVGGQPVQRRCPTDRVFSSLLDDCVFPWDTNADLCPRKEAICFSDSVFEICTKYPTAVFPHPTSCHQYYNCTGYSFLIRYPPVLLPGSEALYRFECVYPQVFNEITLQCDDYRNVQCGVRQQPLDKCEYTAHTCQRPAFCFPCSIPSCRGLSDGRNVYTGKEWTSSFIVCEDQRIVSDGVCSADTRLNMSQIFSPDLRQCVTMYEIPSEHGGSPFNCRGRPDGLYPDDVTRKPNLYFQCTSGALVQISLCPETQYFDQRSSSCVARGYAPLHKPELSSTMSLSSPSVIVGVVLVIVSVARGQKLTSPCTSVFGMLSHPTNCTRFIQCECSSLHVCDFILVNVFCGLCPTVDRVCCGDVQGDPTAMLAHPANCHQYYNCSGHTPLTWFVSQLAPDSPDFYLYECPYPQLFNEGTLRCEDYRDVKCGEKFLPLDPCEYTSNQCRRPRCVECNIRAPSCRGFADGVNVFRGRLWSPYFVVCENQRLVNISSCPIIKGNEVFSPILGRCVNPVEIPEDLRS